MSKHDSMAQKPDAVSLADEEAVKQVLVNSVLGLWDIVNNLTRLRPARRDRYRVTIFGSARAKAGTFGYEETKRAAAALAEMGCDIITGGGPGLMQAANEGAATAPERAQSVGIRVDLPFEQEVNAFVTEAFEHRTFFYAPASVRAHLRRLHRRAGGNRHGPGDHDDLAAAAGPSPREHAADSRGKDVAGPDRMGAQFHAFGRASLGQRGGHDDPALRDQRR
jgi:SLOG cluster4 family